jgi:hypothetical protein
VQEGDARSLASIIGYTLASFPQKYLGLPLTATKLRVRDLYHLVVKLEKHTPGWKGSLLHSGGRLVLADVMLSTLPSHAMSVILQHGTTWSARIDLFAGCSGRGSLNALVVTAKSPGVRSADRDLRVDSVFKTCFVKTCAC